MPFQEDSSSGFESAAFVNETNLLGNFMEPHSDTGNEEMLI
jgi:hypothetical protein